VDQLEVDTWPYNKIFIFFLKRKKEKNLGWLWPPPWAPRGVSATPNGYYGWLGHPHGPKRVAKTIPNGGWQWFWPTPWLHGGGRATLETQGGGRNTPPSGHWGWPSHPQGPKEVAETTPKPPLGVVSATPLAPWG
jgi:hypothetical protein